MVASRDPVSGDITITGDDWARIGGYLFGVRKWIEAAAACLAARPAKAVYLRDMQLDIASTPQSAIVDAIHVKAWWLEVQPAETK